MNPNKVPLVPALQLREEPLMLTMVSKPGMDPPYCNVLMFCLWGYNVEICVLLREGISKELSLSIIVVTLSKKEKVDYHHYGLFLTNPC